MCPEPAGMRLGHPSNVKSSLTATRHVIRAVTKSQLPLAVNQAYKEQRSPNPFALESMHPVLSGTLCKPLLRVQNTHHSVTRSTIQAHVANIFKACGLIPRLVRTSTCTGKQLYAARPLRSALLQEKLAQGTRPESLLPALPLRCSQFTLQKAVTPHGLTISVPDPP